MKSLNYPETKKVNFEEKYFGKTFIDPYIWLENIKEEEVIQWTENQNNFTDEYFADDKKYDVEKLANKLKEKTKEHKHKYLQIIEGYNKIYAIKFDEKGDTYVVILDEDFKEKETIVDNKTFGDKVMIGFVIPPPVNSDVIIIIIPGLVYDNNLSKMIVYDCHNKKIIKQIDNAHGFFSNTDKKIYFTDLEIEKTEGRTINRVKLYDIESDTIQTIYEQDKKSTYITLKPSQCGKYIGIHAHINSAEKELTIIDTTNNSLNELTDNRVGFFEYIGTIEDKHYVQTTVDAEFGKIIAFPVSNSSYEKSYDVIPHSNKIISDARIISNRIIISYMIDVVNVIEIYDKDGNYLRNIDLPSNMGYASFPYLRVATKKPNLHISFGSFTDVPSIMQYNVNTNQSKIITKKKEVRVPDDIVVTRKFITARDGVKVPAFIVHKKDIILDGNNPTLMYGYGGFGSTLFPSFTNPFLGMDVWEWVDKGYVYVSCNVRGGGEYGENWYNQGSRENKKNTFYDFIDITEWLIENKWTKPKKIAIAGGSNGGVLVTVLMTMRPELWGAVVASVPVTDLILKNDESAILVGIAEYGDSKDDEKMFNYILSYSPYQNIKNTEYPSLYIQAGELDHTCPVHHAKKFIAKMQELNQSENPILLRVLNEGGHDRGQGDVKYKTFAEMQTFIAKALKL